MLLFAMDWPALVRGLVFRAELRAAAIALLFGLGALLAFLWRRYRKPDWAENFGDIRIPGGVWIVVGIVVAVVALMVFLFTRDPLVRH